MWSIRTEQTESNRVHRFVVEIDSGPVSFGQVLNAWRDAPDFRLLFSKTLAKSPFTAFRWETPPVSAATLYRPFEFVLINSPTLDRRPDPNAFAEHFGAITNSDVAIFPNIGGDAVMIVPCVIAAPNAYGHLAVFVRQAPAQQCHALWKSVSEAMTRRLSDKPKPAWLSTAGAGVSWLHVRIDDRPKYYGHAPYTRFS